MTAPDQTTLHVRQAVQGDARAIAWLVERFSPFLLAQARFRLPGNLAALAEDVVSEVWLATLPKLGELNERNGRLTPVLVKFLGTVLLRRANDTLRAHLSGTRRSISLGTIGDSDPAAATASVVATAIRSEVAERITHAIDALEETTRHVVVLRIVEQMSNGHVAQRLGLTDGAVSRRFQSGIESLRRRLGADWPIEN